MITHLKNNSLLIIYAFIMSFLAAGVYHVTGTRHLDKLGIYFFSFLLFYFSGQLVLRKIKDNNLSMKFAVNDHVSENLTVGIFIAILATIGIHFFQLGGFPLADAWNSRTIVEASKVRQDITAYAPAFINYLSSFVIKGFIPFFLLFLYATGRKKMFFALLIFSIFYIVNLLQKNYLMFIFMPLLIWLLLSKRFLSFLIYTAIPVIGIFFLVYVTNPENRQQKGSVKAKEVVKTTGNSAQGLSNRVIYIPGKIVAEWFNRIPSEMPFLNGCGYHFAARLTGCEYHDYSKILYTKIYPQYVKMGLEGSVNTASFVYDYSNFGRKGLVMSAIIMAVLFLFINYCFAGDWKWMMVLNSFPVMMLSSAALTTLLFSGGWGIQVFLFFIFRKQIKS